MNSTLFMQFISEFAEIPVHKIRLPDPKIKEAYYTKTAVV